MELIQKVIKIAQESDSEKLEIDDKFDISDGLFYLSDKSIEYRMTPRPKSKQLDSFLEKLSLQDLVLLEAVMDGGKELIKSCRAFPLQENISYYNSIHNSTKHLAVNISEKSSLVKYLEAGIKAYSSEYGHVRGPETGNNRPG